MNTRKQRFVSRFVVVSVLTTGLVAPWITLATAEEGEYVFRASARLFSIATSRTVTAKVKLGIKRWTTDEERRALLDKLVAAGPGGGTEALAMEFQNAEQLGFITVDGAYNHIYYAYEFKDGDKRRIVVATERALNYAEVQHALRTEDYTIALATIELNEKGKGEGKLSPASQINFNPETKRLDVTINAVQPYRLTGIRLR